MLRNNAMFWLVLLLGAAVGRAAIRDEFPQAPMPPPVLQLLLDANRATTLTNENKRARYTGALPGFIAQSKTTNEAALKVFGQLPWPDFSKFKRVRCRYIVGRTLDTNTFVARWLFHDQGDQLILLDDLLAKEWRIRRETQMEDTDYGTELAELLESPRVVMTNAPRRTTGRSAETMPLFYHAVAAAWLGHTNEARQILQLAVNTEYASQTLWNQIGARARGSFEEGLKQLREGAPRSEVLRQWSDTLRIYGSTLAHTQLVDYVTILKQQVEEFPRLTASTVENPASLPLATRAAYYVERFQEIKAGTYGEKTLEDAVVALGREAIPALLEHLRDRRLTRLTGAQRSYSSYYEVNSGTVLRVQDLALSAIESISKVRFLDARKIRGGPIFSARPPAEREELAASVEAWWKENAEKSSTAWRLARLETLPLRERISEAAELERLDPKATNYTALLKSWANETRRAGVPDLARALAARGDLSLIPQLREEWRAGRFNDVEMLLKYGQAEDFGLLRDAEYKRRLERPDQTYSLYVFRLGSLLGGSSRVVPAPTNNLFVPLLVDTLSYRTQNQGSYLDGKFRNSSHADLAMTALIALTGHNEGFDTAADVATRHAAIDRWQDWWTRHGEKEWLAAHPETRPAFGSVLEQAPVVLDMTSLNDLVRIFPASQDGQIVYEAPREQLAALVRSGAVQVKQFAGVTQFRFTSAASELKWFATAKAQPFAKAAYTNHLGQARTIVHRPRLTTNAFLFPALQIDAVEFVVPDTRGRTWLVQRGVTNAMLRFEAGRWQTLLSFTNDLFGSSPHEFHFAFSLRDGAMILAEGHNEKRRLHLFDGKEHREFPDVESLVQIEGKRLRKLLSFPPDAREHGFGQNPEFHLTKDGEGNIWWSEARRLGVISGTNKVVARREDFLIEGGTYFNFQWFTPLPKGAGVIAADYQNAAVLTLEGGRLKRGAQTALPGAALTDTGSHWPRFLRARNGSVWVSARESVAFDAALQRAGTEHGSLLLRDSKDALWFVDYNHSLDTGLTRRTDDGQTSQIRLRGLKGPPCDHGDGTVWAHTSDGLVRVAHRRGKLEVIEEAAVPGANNTRLWSDGDGHLWVADENSLYYGRRLKVTCYSTRH